MNDQTRQDYQTAIDVQDACNLSGVLFSWAAIVQRMCDDPGEYGIAPGTDERNRHPINVLMADKLASLAGRDYGEAYGSIRAAIKIGRAEAVTGHDGPM